MTACSPPFARTCNPIVFCAAVKRSRSILLLVTDLHIGGTPVVVRELACRLQRTGLARIEVACLATSGPVAGQLQAAGIKVTALGARGPFDFRVFGRLKRLIRSKNFDTVLSFLVHANVAATLARVNASSNGPPLTRSG